MLHFCKDLVTQNKQARQIFSPPILTQIFRGDPGADHLQSETFYGRYLRHVPRVRPPHLSVIDRPASGHSHRASPPSPQTATTRLATGPVGRRADDRLSTPVTLAQLCSCCGSRPPTGRPRACHPDSCAVSSRLSTV